MNNYNIIYFRFKKEEKIIKKLFLIVKKNLDMNLIK